MDSTESRKDPLLFRKALSWSLLSWSLDDWRTVFSDEKMSFRSGLFGKTAEPQWERSTESFDETFEYFLKHTQRDTSLKWLYFDYKYLRDCSAKLDKLRNELNWKSLGFDGVGPDDGTIWIGSRGAHTPCHADTYGYNVVCQLYGTKLWLLFPPDENLQPTRIPYEESSIYSKLNFFSPNCNDLRYFRNITTCRKIVLEPGDILIVPHKWWHYVENLETSISINAWIPQLQDREERLKESIVQFFVKQLSDIEGNNQILNPNMEDLMLTNTSGNALDIVKQCITECQSKNLHKRMKHPKADEITSRNILINSESIPLLTRQEFFSFMREQNDKFPEDDPDNENTGTLFGGSATTNYRFLNALTHPEVIELIKDKILND